MEGRGRFSYYSPTALSWAITLAHVDVPLKLSLHPSIFPYASCRGLRHLLLPFASKTCSSGLETSKNTGHRPLVLSAVLKHGIDGHPLPLR